MRTAASVSRAPFVGLVQPKVCDCACDPKELFTARTVKSAVTGMGGHWAIYLTFYGDQTHWLDFLVVDVRDGRIVWRNGHLTQEEKENGESERDDWNPGAGRTVEPGRWIGSGRSTVEPGSGSGAGKGW